MVQTTDKMDCQVIFLGLAMSVLGFIRAYFHHEISEAPSCLLFCELREYVMHAG